MYLCYVCQKLNCRQAKTACITHSKVVFLLQLSVLFLGEEQSDHDTPKLVYGQKPDHGGFISSQGSRRCLRHWPWSLQNVQTHRRCVNHKCHQLILTNSFVALFYYNKHLLLLQSSTNSNSKVHNIFANAENQVFLSSRYLPFQFYVACTYYETSRKIT